MMSQKRSIGQLASAAWFEFKFKAESGPQTLIGDKKRHRLTPDQHRRLNSKLWSENAKLKRKYDQLKAEHEEEFRTLKNEMRERIRLGAASIYSHIREIMEALGRNELSVISDILRKIVKKLGDLKYDFGDYTPYCGVSKGGVKDYHNVSDTELS